MTPLGIEFMIDPRGLPDRPTANGVAELDRLVRGFDAFLQDALPPSADQHGAEQLDVSVRSDQIDLRGSAATFDWHGVLILRTLQAAEPVEMDAQPVQSTEIEARIMPLASADGSATPLRARQSAEGVSPETIDPVDQTPMRVLEASAKTDHPVPSVRPDLPQAVMMKPSRLEPTRLSSAVVPTAAYIAGPALSVDAVMPERPANPVMQTARSIANTLPSSPRSQGPSTAAAPSRPEPMAGQTSEPRISMTRGETGLIIHVATALLSPEGEKRLRARLTHIVREAGEVIETLTITMTGQSGSGAARQDTVTRKGAYHGSY